MMMTSNSSSIEDVKKWMCVDKEKGRDEFIFVFAKCLLLLLILVLIDSFRFL